MLLAVCTPLFAMGAGCGGGGKNPTGDKMEIIEGDSGFLYRSRTQPHNPLDVIGPQVQLNMDPEKGLVSTITLEMGGSSSLCSLLEEGEPVVLMGPTGAALQVSDQSE